MPPTEPLQQDQERSASFILILDPDPVARAINLLQISRLLLALISHQLYARKKRAFITKGTRLSPILAGIPKFV